MTSARNFYLIFMKLAKSVKSATTKAQLAKNIHNYIQPLACCFDDDGLNIMDNYHLTNGDMVLDYTPEYPLLKNKCDSIHHDRTYECTTVQKPVKSYVGNQLISTSKKTYEYLNYPTKNLVYQYMITLLNKALDNTQNRYDSANYGGFWIDRSGITPLEEYRMRNAIGIKTPKTFISKAKHNLRQGKLDKSRFIKQQIKENQNKIQNLKKAYSYLHK